MREYIHNGFHVLMDEDHAERVGATPVTAKSAAKASSKAAEAPENKAAPAPRKKRPTATSSDGE